MLHLYYFESLLEQHVIIYGHKVGPRIMSIQDRYNKNYHIKCIEYYEKFDSSWLFGDIKMVILDSC